MALNGFIRISLPYMRVNMFIYYLFIMVDVNECKNGVLKCNEMLIE